MSNETEKLDTKGEVCPMPAVLTKRRIESLRVGEVLEVTGDCAPALENIEKWARNHGHEVLEISKSGDYFSIKIKKH